MDSEQYWARRADERERYWHKKSQETIEKELARYYASSLEEIQKDIQALYGRFAKDNQLSMTDARKLLQGPEFRKWRYTIDTYVKKIGAGEAGLLKELNTLAMRSRISRLDKLYADTLMELDSLGRKTDSAMKSFLTDAYKDNYFHGMYEIGRTMGLKAPRVAVTNQSLEDVLRNRWSGKNYSERIWKNQRLLGRTLQQEMTTAIHRGESVHAISKRIANRMDVANSHATRLVRTELNYVENMATLRSIKDAGTDYYRFIATLDSRTTDICRSHDGSIISVEEASPGDNLPPLHPNCRSTISGSLYGPDDDHKRGGTRIARTAEGKNYYVPADMTYPEWEDKYAIKAQTLPKNPHAGKAVLVDVVANSAGGNTVKVYEGEKIHVDVDPKNTQYYKSAAVGDENIIVKRGQQEIVFHQTISYPSMFIAEGISIKPKQMHVFQQKLREAAEIVGEQTTSQLPPIFVMDEIQMQKNVVAAYGFDEKRLYLVSAFFDTQKLAVLQKDGVLPDNPLSSLVHELLHWKDAQRYLFNHGNMKGYKKWIRAACQKKVEALIRKGYNVCVSQYEMDMLESNAYDEVYTEFRTLRLLKGGF